MSNNYPSFSPANELGYKVGAYAEFVPSFLGDTVMIRPYGEYGSATYQVISADHGGYAVNSQSALTDPAGVPASTDLVYLVNYDLAVLPAVKRVIIALHWYTSLEASAPTIEPAIGIEVQAWNWRTPPPAEYIAYPWTRANAYRLKITHQVWPTLDDNALLDGIKYLQGAGYEVGLCPIATLISQNFYFAGGGEWEVDRSLLQWAAGNATGFNNYIAAFDSFYRHYIDLCAQNNIRPWIMYLGYGMRDITGCGVQPFMVQFVNEIRTLAEYAKQKLPNTLLTYAADLDEYYYSYLVRQNNGHLDPLWTCASLDFVGINWFAPLALDDIDDSQALIQGVMQREANNFTLTNFDWRASTIDRLISTTTRNFKTGLAQTTINPLTLGVKDIIDWLSFYHYYPAIDGVLAGVSPLPNIFPGDPRLCTHIHGVGPTGSLTVKTPTQGGIAPIPNPVQATWVTVALHSYLYLNMPAQVPDSSVFNFEFQFAIDPALTNITGNYRLYSSPNLKIDSLNGTITLAFTTLRGSIVEMPLFYDTKGDISLVWTPTQIKILVNGAYDLTAPTPANDDFLMPLAQDYVWMGNPQSGNIGSPLPSGYSAWQGQIYFLSLVMGTGDNVSGGQYYFDDAYCGIRTAWTPNQKPWMATSFGYSSVHGSAVDPQTRGQVILATGSSQIPNWYEEYETISAAGFRNGFIAWNIQGPYGSDFAIDDVYQATVMNAAALGIIDAGAVHQVAWYFDTRNNSAYKALLPDNARQIFNDAYDYEINSCLNGKAAVRYGGSQAIYVPITTPSESLGLSIVPGPLPYQKVIPVQPGVPQI